MREWILNNLILNGKLIANKCKKSWFIKNNYITEYNNIISLTHFLDNPQFSQRIWHIINNIYNKVKCHNPHCNNFAKFHTFNTGYLRTCCNKCAQLDPQTINKIKQTNHKKYGTDYGLSNKNIIEKRKQSCINHFGVDNPTKSKLILDNIKSNNIKKYGIDWLLRDKDKKESFIYKKYGVNNVQKNKSIHQKTVNTKRELFYNSLFTTNRLNGKVTPLFTKEEYITHGYYNNYKFKCNQCNNEFIDCLEDGDIPRCPICYKQSSLFEIEILDYIKSIYNGNILSNDKTILNGKELDIYIPDLNLAIECDGLYYHSEHHGNKDKTYHINKTKLCETKGIQLIHIFEDEWLYKKDIIKTLLLNIINPIDVTDYNIKPISYSDSRLFLNNYHINDNCKSTIQLGLYNNNELIYVMTFIKLKNNNYKICRFCSLVNVNIKNGFDILINYFIKSYSPNKIILYIDHRWNIYNESNFKKVKEYPPKCWFFGKGNKYRRYKKLINYYDKIWDCGYMKYEFITNYKNS